MQMINSTNPAANALNQQSASNASPANAGSDLISKMFQNQGGIGNDLLKMLMNPSSLQNPQEGKTGSATSDSDGVQSTGNNSTASSKSSSASDASSADGTKDAGAVIEKLLGDLTALMNLLKNQMGDAKQTQGNSATDASQDAESLDGDADEESDAVDQPTMSTRPQELGAASQATPTTPTTGSSSSSQSQSNSANGNTTTTNTTDGKTTTTRTNDQSNVVRGNNLDSTNGTPSTAMTAGSLNQASLARESKAVNDSLRGVTNTGTEAKANAMPTSLDDSVPTANSFNLNGTINDGKPVGSADLKLGDVNVKASLDDASELSVGADAKLTPSTTATLSGDKGGIDAGVKFDDGNTNIGAKVNNIGGSDTNAQFDAGTKIGNDGFVKGSYNTNGAASFGLGLNF